jgi:hypothetical protein
MWAQIINAIVGLWLLAAPAVLGYGGAARTDGRILGPLIAGVALIARCEVTRPVRWANVPLGLGLALSPWLVGFHGVARPLDVVLGAIVIACALVRGGYEPGRFGGGWAVLSAEPSEAPPGGERA